MARLLAIGELGGGEGGNRGRETSGRAFLQGGKVGELEIAFAEGGRECDREDGGGAEFGVDRLSGKVEDGGDDDRLGVLHQEG